MQLQSICWFPIFVGCLAALASLCCKNHFAIVVSSIRPLLLSFVHTFHINFSFYIIFPGQVMILYFFGLLSVRGLLSPFISRKTVSVWVCLCIELYLSFPKEFLFAHTKIESIRVLFQLGVVKILLLSFCLMLLLLQCP